MVINIYGDIHCAMKCDVFLSRYQDEINRLMFMCIFIVAVLFAIITLQKIKWMLVV